jgi:hypothetical protein
MPYSQCPVCGYISSDPTLDNPEIPCPGCGKPANLNKDWGCRIMFPHLNAVTVLRSIKYFYKQTKQKTQEETERILLEIKAISKNNLKEEDLKVFKEKLREIEEEKNLSDDEAWHKMMQTIASWVQVNETGAEEIIGILGSYPPRIHEGIAVITLTCTLLELCLDNFLSDFLKKIGTPYLVADEIFDELRYTDKKINFLNKLTGKNFKKYLKSLDNGKFFSEWKEDKNSITKLRNNIVHRGHVSSISDADVKKGYNLSVQGIKIFAKLNNEFCIKI